MSNYNEDTLKSIEETCQLFSKQIIDKVCKKSTRSVNKLTAAFIDPMEKYPATFRVFDILSVEFQHHGLDEMDFFVEPAVEKILWQDYENLSLEDKFFVTHRECTVKEFLDDNEIFALLRNRFNELLNEHWVNTKRIQNFEQKKSW